jgi:Rrf2 family protein
MYELAQLPTGATLSIRDLCEAADVPENFGASLATYLIAAGLVRSEGYNSHLMSLARPAEEITMGQIIRASEPEFSLAQCTHEPESCNRSSNCGVHLMWIELDAIVWERLDTIALAEVATGTRAVAPRVASQPA